MISKILIVRTDRLGDVLLTTPMVSALKAAYPQSRVAFLVRPYTASLLDHNPGVDQVIIDRDGPVGPLVWSLRQERFDVAIVALPRWRVAWATWRAGIPMRIGPASKWYSLLFSHRIWQNRSESKKHEADYNLDLLSPLKVPFQRFPTRFVLADDEKQWARKELEGHRISFQKPLVVLHPGSGGSSSRWPLMHFMELGDRFQEAGCDVVVTGGPGEDYQYMMIDNMRRIPVFVAAGSVSVRQLAAILAHANLVVSNSTGPLHLADALGVPTVSIYSSVPACHPRRWGPYPAFVEGRKEHEVVIAPDLGLDPADMTQVTVEQVWEVCRGKLKLLRGTPIAGAAVN